MKRIKKGLEPLAFSQWKALENDDWKPSYGDLSGAVKKAVTDSLMQEQGNICCYCEQAITPSDSHIEHLNPQEHAEALALDYGNMLRSCQNRLKKGQPRHCGNAKGSWYEAKHFISPLMQGCEERFAFDGFGNIQPASETDTAAAITIQTLALDIPKLNTARREALAPFLDPELTPQEMTDFAEGYLRTNPDGGFNSFWTTIKQVIGNG